MSTRREQSIRRRARHLGGSALVAALALAACRSGGPDANRMTDGTAGSDGAGGRPWGLSVGPASRDAAVVVTDDAAVLGGHAGAAAVTGSGGEAGHGGAPNATGGTGADAGAPIPEAGTPPTSNGCSPPVESSGCDPVCDTGCAALSRCDVTDEPRTGRCIGVWISGEGDLCLKTAVTDPCAAHLSCVEGACRRLCYRDSDCASPGSCCGQDLLLDGQPSGYKICVACPR